MQAATLRRRHQKLAASQSKLAASLPADAARPPPRRAPHIMTARLRLVATAAVILVVFVLLKARSSTQLRGYMGEEGEGWVKLGKMDRRMYALCARKGAGEPIWTVGGGEEERVQCLVVQGKEVLETGSLGTSPTC